MADRFPDYDVLEKRDTMSWNAVTRGVIDARIARAPRTDILSPAQRDTLAALIDRIVPQPADRAPVNALAMLLDKIAADEGDGYRIEGLPRVRAAWEAGLDAIEREARARHGRGFVDLDGALKDAMIAEIGQGDTRADWGDLNPAHFHKYRLIPDIVSAYYAHPSAWSAMGFGGPASPRGYVRIDANRRDPWEAAERGDGGLLPARMRNRHVG